MTKIDIFRFTIPENKIMLTASIEELISSYVSKEKVTCIKDDKVYELEFNDYNSRESFKKKLKTLGLYKN